MVIIKLSGGLGNQLFQYNFGEFLSNYFEIQVKYHLKLNSKSKNFTNREFGLKNIIQENELIDDLIASKYYIFNSEVLNRIEKKITYHFPFINKKIIIEKYDFKFPLYKTPLNSYYEGYWQSYNLVKYVNNNTNIYKQFDVKLDLSNQLHFNKIKKNKSVSIHVRRGDYLTKKNRSIYNTCNLKYYQDAINILNKRYEDLHYFIFTDDIKWVMKNFKSDFTIIGNNDKEPIIDLYLMSKCDHNIIANSTFSWWGAFLNKNLNKTVISPTKWYLDEKINKITTDKLLPKNWIKI